MKWYEAKRMALELMQKHDLKGWIFKGDKARARLGYCLKSEKKITLSVHFVRANRPSTIKNTILHEIAHALDEGRGHGRSWRKICQDIGARPERLTVCAAPTNVKTYIGACPSCNRKWTRYRPRRDCYCRTCRAKGLPNIITWCVSC